MSAHPHPAHQQMYTYPSMQQHHQDTYIMQMQQQAAAYMKHMQQQQHQQQQQIQQQQHQQLNAEDGAVGNGAAPFQWYPPWYQPGAVQGGAVQGGAQPQAWPQQQQQYNPNAPRQDGAQGQLHPGQPAAYGGFPYPSPSPLGYYNPGYHYAAMEGGMNPGSFQGGRPENAQVGLNPSTSSSTSATSTSANSYPSTQGDPASVNGDNGFSRNEQLRPINQIAGLNGEQGIRQQGILCLAALCERKGQNDLRNSNATASLASVGLGETLLNKITVEELFQQKKRAIEDNMQNDHQILNLQQMLELQAVANLANKGRPINAAKKQAEPEQK
eukprot:CAMPEP_0182511038 /NCGR_PEP_ID=MMETSP1321-20130603/29822_1 /TAXON_ID=91990 /ORGANISM="Bolidomonas sp., Strain RCC1657" /LENGTH=327 /DNA_ID=CAMNT_0024717615 /DNA_START=44 /DNA_END=1027 /DNA_ORIENTATION=+